MKRTGQVALVTGGAVRLGRAVAESLARRELIVAVHHAASREAARETVAAITESGGHAELFQADFGDGAAACHDLVERVRRSLGPPSVLINNAAVFEPATWDSLTESAWDRAMTINLKAPVFLAQAFARFARGAENGTAAPCIVNLLDWRATHPCPGHLAYTTAKAALATVTRILAVELGELGIRVNGVAPGAILPPAGADARYLKTLAERNCLNRMGAPDDVVQAVHYLLDAEFVVGEILHVTAGEQLR